MSSVKISGLPASSNLNVNPAQSIFPTVDYVTGQTTQLSGKDLGDSLYANNTLIVGTGGVILPNTVTQFTGFAGGYVQVNEQNLSNTGSADYIVTADTGTDLNYYIDMGITNSSYNNTSPYNSLSTSIEPLAGYLYVQGNYANNAQGNLVIGTVNAGTETRFIAGGSKTANVIYKVTSSGINILNNKSIIFSDGSTQITAGVPAAYVQAAYAQANVTIGVDATQNSRITIIEGVNVGQNTAIAATDGKMQSAYNTANNALANTTGTFAGTLNISNNLTVNGNIVLANSNFSATEAAFRITASGSSQTPTQDGTLMQLTSKQNTPARVLIDSIGTSNTAYSLIAGRTARGTIGAPTATQNNDILLRIAGNSYGTTGYAPFGDARIDFVATENHSDTNRGSRIRFWNTPIGTNTVNEIASFNGDSVTFTGTVAPVKGFIYTPLVYPSAQTAITIDFANNSMVRAQTSSGLVVSMSNYTVGKIVELWITNLAGTSQTYTTGVSAINSTLNATTYNIPSTSTICARYFCVDGTLANTLVSVIHA
jgi:hypothetical protein